MYNKIIENPWFFIITISILLTCMYVLYKLNKIECFEPINIPNDNLTTNIIVSRYNESLKWTLDSPYNQYKYIVYNKGPNDNFEHKHVSHVIKLPNVGRESHTYLKHIIDNYDNLADINIFLPGSIDTNHKIFKKKLISKTLLKNIKEYKNAVFLSFDNIKDNDITQEFEGFNVTAYRSTTSENQSINNEYIIRQSNIRPYEKWFQHIFGNIKVPFVIHYGIFSVNKNDILKKPKSYYENLINYVSDHSNPEDGHYFEKSWGAVFYPFEHTHVVKDPKIKDPFKGKYKKL